jgi:hypothetical protein
MPCLFIVYYRIRFSVQCGRMFVEMWRGGGIMTAGCSWLAGGCDSGERRVRLSCDTTEGRWRTGSSPPRGSFPRVCKHWPLKPYFNLSTGKFQNMYVTGSVSFFMPLDVVLWIRIQLFKWFRIQIRIWILFRMNFFFYS